MVDEYFEREVTKRGVKKGAGWPLTYSMEIDEQLLVWVVENCDLHLLVTIPRLQAKAMKLIGTEYPDFKASSGWAYKFMHRHSLVLQACTSMAQELPATLEEWIQAFYCQIMRVAGINKFEVVGNIDETPLYFDVVPGRVLDKKGKRSGTHHRKSEVTFDCCSYCSCRWCGIANPCHLQGKKRPKLHEVGVFIWAREKAWMDKTMMLEWIDLVWDPATEGRRALFILDSFSAHITVTIKQKLKEINTVPVVIPGGCTKCNPWIWVWTSHLSHTFVADYILEQPANLQTKKLKPPQKEDVASWISSALEELQDKPDMVVRSFEACGILNYLDSEVWPIELLEGQLYTQTVLMNLMTRSMMQRLWWVILTYNISFMYYIILILGKLHYQ